MREIFLKSLISIVLYALIFLNGCGTTRHQFHAGDEGSDPVGVDSLTLAEADSIIPHLFVNFHHKQKSTQLCNDGERSLTAADSLWQLLRTEIRDSSQNSDTTSETILTREKRRQSHVEELTKCLVAAEKNFQKSIELNPFALDCRDGLARTYFLKADVEKNNSNFVKAEQVLLEILEREKGEHNLYFNLGECYFKLEQWENAFQNYSRAASVFSQTKDFYFDSTRSAQAQDSSANALNFTYLYSQAVCLSRMYRSAEALEMIRQAKTMAETEQRKSIAAHFENWLNWDNGNIQSAEKKNNILNLVKAEKYTDAANQFQTLKESLSDRDAIDEIEWRIAGLEFQYLNKKEQACDRLLRVIRNREKTASIALSNQENMRQYLKDCGAMHYYLGMNYIEKADYRSAKDYLAVGAEIEWSGKYKCQLELAKMNKHNPQMSLELIQKVLSADSNLTIPEKIDALQVKLKVLKKLGPDYLLEAKQTYLQIRELQKN
ncbi:MAG: hypothetical protein ACOY90_13190 [Candidatus Zhuqueibacterota bacterium]